MFYFLGSSSQIISTLEQILSSVETSLAEISTRKTWNSSTNTYSASQGQAFYDNPMDGSILDGTSTVIQAGGYTGAAVVVFIVGVFITAVGNLVFYLVYDNREAIYETLTVTIDSIGDTLSDVSDSITSTVGNAVVGFVNGLATVFD